MPGQHLVIVEAQRLVAEEDGQMLGERLLEVYFAAHGAGRDARDLLLTPRKLRQLVDELALHEGRIDVHTHEPLAAPEHVVALHGQIHPERHAQPQQRAAQVAELARAEHRARRQIDDQLQTVQVVIAERADLADIHGALGHEVGDRRGGDAVAQRAEHGDAE